MSAGHSHSHAGSASAGGAHRWRLQLTFVMVAAFFVVELAVGLAASSLALISDAGHMAADVVTLGAALVATRIASRRDTTGRRTFGSYRAEIFASGAAVLVMLGVSAYIGIEAISRIGSVVEVASTPLIVVGAIGLVINVVSIALLRAGSKESLNLKGAYLEVVADAIGSVGVIAAGVLVAATGQGWWDTIIALAIAVFVAVRAIALGREVVAVLGQHAPAGIEPDAVDQALREVAGVAAVHDLHLWTLTSGMNVATAHLVTAPDPEAGGEGGGVDRDQVLAAAGAVMRERFGIEHATLQVEPTATTACTRTTW